MQNPAKGSGKAKTVFILDDHPLVREFLTALINQQDGLTVCGEADTPSAAFLAISGLQPDVAVVDISLPTGSAIRLIKDLSKILPSTKVLVLSMHEERVYAERAIRAGARGYLNKCQSSTKIIDAIRSVLDGRLFVTEEFQSAMLESSIAGAPKPEGVSLLRDRELDVFRMLGSGMRTREIAESLGIGMKTVQVYYGRIKTTLGLSNATELVREATRFWEKRE